MGMTAPSASGLRVLWTLPYLPWPVTSGGKARQFHLLREMARRGHAVTLLVQSKTALDEAARAALEPLVERLIVLPRRPLRDLRTLWFAACSSQPLLASVNGHAPALAMTYAMGVYPGAAGLAVLGLATTSATAPDAGLEPYPRMARWLRD